MPTNKCKMSEPIVCVKGNEKFGSINWQKRVSEEVVKKLDSGQELTPGEKHFIKSQLEHEERERRRAEGEE